MAYKSKTKNDLHKERFTQRTIYNSKSKNGQQVIDKERFTQRTIYTKNDLQFKVKEWLTGQSQSMACKSMSQNGLLYSKSTNG